MNQSSTARIGVMAGLLAILYITVLYVTDQTLLVVGYERVTLLIFTGAVIYGVAQLRPTQLKARSLQELAQAENINAAHAEQEFKSFGELLQGGFRIYFIAFLMKFIFVYLLFHYYDPSLIDLVREESVRIYMEQSDFSNDTQEVIEQKIAFYREGEFGPSLTDVLGLILELLLGFVVAFFTALLLKRDRPDY